MAYEVPVATKSTNYKSWLNLTKYTFFILHEIVKGSWNFDTVCLGQSDRLGAAHVALQHNVHVINICYHAYSVHYMNCNCDQFINILYATNIQDLCKVVNENILNLILAHLRLLRIFNRIFTHSFFRKGNWSKK